MGRRQRAKANLFDPSASKYWVVVETAYGKIIESTAVLPGADLLRLFLLTLLKYHDDGWKLIEFSSCHAQFYATKDGEKRCVQITSTDPTAPKPSPPNLMHDIVKR